MAMMFFGRSARTRGTHVNQKRKIIMIIIKILTHTIYTSTIHVFRHRRRLVSPVLYIFSQSIPIRTLYYKRFDYSFVSYARDDANSYPKS